MMFVKVYVLPSVAGYSYDCVVTSSVYVRFSANKGFPYAFRARANPYTEGRSEAVDL
ncbi:MAG: hypothetical protein KatS3mg099_187 [Candidatus Parcubacteria bacterium]|nr:MAG: hypothetical protein KatS3mg099_187 [Candidatus Parcubacteria bacterium]